MKKLLTAAVMLGGVLLFAAPGESGLNRDYWTKENHNGQRNVRELLKKHVAPTGSDVMTDSEAKSWTNPKQNANWADDYAQRMYGFVVPEITGEYVFYIAADDAGSLFLSPDENPANVKQIARTSVWTNPRQYTKSPSQKSAPVKLEKGKKYYMEVIMFEGGGGDNLSIAWIAPGKTVPEIIPSRNLKTAK